MADFKPALDKTLASEGGFYDRSATTGEVVSMGITLSFLRSIGQLPGAAGSSPSEGEIEFIKALTPEAVSPLYEIYFWRRCGCDAIEDQRLAEKLFDLAVNCGNGAAVEFLQRAINRFSWPGLPIAVDGMCGPKTIAEANSISRLERDQLYGFFKQEAAKYYRDLGKRRPQDQPFVAGWLARLERA